MRTYKLFREKNHLLYPLFVLSNKPVPMQKWIRAEMGDLIDENHVRSTKLGVVRRRPGWHSTEVPFTDWIGKKGKDGRLYQSPDTVWCECEVEGEQVFPEGRYGSRDIPDGWYYFKTRPGQEWPWIISDCIYVKRKLSHAEVEEVCQKHGIHAQPLWAEGGKYGY